MVDDAVALPPRTFAGDEAPRHDEQRFLGHHGIHDAAAVEAEYKRQTSLRTFVTTDDIADMVLYLTSPAGQRITGQALAIDGHTEGLSMDMEGYARGLV